MRRPTLPVAGPLASLFAALLGASTAWAAPAAASLCERGRQQSPIDIVATERQALPALQAAYRAAPLRLVHDGHTVRVRFPTGGAAASRLMLGDQALTLTQFHFHLPGGDRLRGEDFPMAMHFLHRAPDGRLIPLVLLWRVGAEHPALAELLPQLPAAGRPERSPPGVSVDPARWLPATLGYYRYDGSETAPPCREGVRWLVLKQVQTLSTGQLDALRRLIAPNARAVQPLNGRVVLESP
jgi:carbonic anhydrase